MSSNRTRKQGGMNFLDLIIVVVIISVLAALAIPRIIQSTTRAKQGEAKTLLKQIHTMQRAYWQENGTYADNLPAIQIEVPDGALYDYHITVEMGGNWYTCMATANLDGDPYDDVWRIDHTGTLTCVSDDAAPFNDAH